MTAVKTISGKKQTLPYICLGYSSAPTTLYAIVPNHAILKSNRQHWQIFHQNQLHVQIPKSRICQIVLFGRCHLSRRTIRQALAQNVRIAYFSLQGNYLGCLEPESPKLQYLSQQARCARQPKLTRETAASILRVKLQNCLTLLKHLKQQQHNQTIETSLKAIAQLQAQLPANDSPQNLHRYKGLAASIYYCALGSALGREFGFSKRTKRPPLDPANALLGLGYSLLDMKVATLLATKGLHPHFGNLHAGSDRRAALVLDLVQAFQPVLVDALVVRILTTGKLSRNSFLVPSKSCAELRQSKGIYLEASALHEFLQYWEKYLTSLTTHPYTNTQVSYERCLDMQVCEYIAWLCGDAIAYRPFLWKG